tara:strand:- start:41928 stop:42833 length:906 start_codon:yes stop_codon:yes gene_type:complete
MPISRINTSGIADNAIISSKIAQDIVLAEDIANNAVTVNELANNAVTTDKILDGTILTADLANDCVTIDKLANNSVGTDQIVDDSITLGTHTTGNYMVNVAAGSGISISHTQSEASTATISYSPTNDSITMGTHTTGQYVGSLAVNSPITKSGGAGPENATPTLSLDLTTDYNFQSQVKAKSYVDVHASVSYTGGTNDFSLDLSTSNSFKVTLTQNSDILFSNVPSSATETMIWTLTIQQIASGAAKSVVYPTNVHWPGGQKPTLSSTNGAIDQFVFMKTGGSSNIYGFTVGQDIKAPASP